MPDVKQIPADPLRLRIDDDGPVLLGSACPKCGISVFPRRWECPVDQTPMGDVDLARAGVLNAFTFISKPWYGTMALDAKGYGVCQVDLPEGVRMQCVLLGDPASWTAGETAYLVAESIGVDAEGNERMVHRFTNERPA